MISAPDLFALSQGAINKGSDRCHWCGSACERLWVHDEEPLPPYSKKRSSAKCFGNAYVCCGCWLYRRKRVTVLFLSEGFRDGQTFGHQSFFLTERKVVALRDADHLRLYEHLLKPPTRFVLALKTPACEVNEIHLAIANDYSVVQADTPLHYTLDNQPHSYTVYELQVAIEQGDGNGTEPGVQALLRFLGQPVSLKKPSKTGHPGNTDGRVTQKVISTSSGHPTPPLKIPAKSV